MTTPKIVKLPKKSVAFWRKEEDRLRRILTVELRKVAIDVAKLTLADEVLTDAQKRAIFRKADALSSQRGADAAQVITATTKKRMDLNSGIERGNADLEASLEALFSRERASGIAITEITTITSKIQWFIYKELDKTVTWKTSKDERVCSICTPLDETPIEDELDLPPAHVRCRCRIEVTHGD